jgi:hypothetical protein
MICRLKVVAGLEMLERQPHPIQRLSRASLVGQRIWLSFEVHCLDGLVDGPVEVIRVGDCLMGEVMCFSRLLKKC